MKRRSPSAEGVVRIALGGWRSLLAAFAYTFVATCMGCASMKLPAPGLPPPPVEAIPSAIQVGTARADLTMPPGTALFGHGPDGRVASGYWTRTYCRVFYFESAQGQKLALVPCELAAVSALLQRSVASKVADLLHVSQVMLTATHTHAAAAHYFGNRRYTGVFSTRAPGFDAAMLEALSDQIAAAVRAAYWSKRSARLSWAERDDLWCFTRNRSLEAYRNNPEPLPFVVPDLACLRGRDDYQAVDPSLSVLRIDAYDPAHPERTLGPLGSLSFLAMHPTVVQGDNQLLGGDVFGVVSRDVERELRRQWCASHPTVEACSPGCTDHVCAEVAVDPLHGVINTNEGDMAAIWTRGDIDEATTIGHHLADVVWRAHPQAQSGNARPLLDARYLEEDLRGQLLGNGDHTCGYPQFGQGAGRGASDHPTAVGPLPLFSASPEVDEEGDSCQAPKRPLLGGLSVLLQGHGGFPQSAPLALVRLDDRVLAFVPGELTAKAGYQVRQAIHEALRGEPGAIEPGAHETADPASRVLIAGLANEYIQYVTTFEEYQLQAYEGASTLYGAHSARYFAERLSQLARSFVDRDVERALAPRLGKALPLEFNVGPSRERLARSDGASCKRAWLGLCTMPGPREPPRLCNVWHDAGPGDVALRDAPWIRLVHADPALSPVRLCYAEEGRCDAGGFVDDRGEAFRTRVHEQVGGGWVWSTSFVPDSSTWQELPGTPLRFVAAAKTQPVVSQSFSRAHLPPACTTSQARLCRENTVTRHWPDLVRPWRAALGSGG